LCVEAQSRHNFGVSLHST